MSKGKSESSTDTQAEIDAIMRALQLEDEPPPDEPDTAKIAQQAKPVTAEDIAAALGVPDLSGVARRPSLFDDPEPLASEPPPEVHAVAPTPPEPEPPQHFVDPDPIGQELRRQTRRILEAHGLDPTIVREPERPPEPPPVWAAPTAVAASEPPPQAAPHAPAPAPAPEPPTQPVWVVPAAVPAPEPFSQDVWRAAAVPAAPKPAPRDAEPAVPAAAPPEKPEPAAKAAPEPARPLRAQPADEPEVLKPTTPPKPAPIYVKDLYTHLFASNADDQPAQPAQPTVKGGGNPTMYLGTVGADDSILDDLVQQRRAILEREINKHGSYLGIYDVMPFEEYIYTVKSYSRLSKDYRSPDFNNASFTQAQRYFLHPGRLDYMHTPDAKGWRNYINFTVPNLVDKALKDHIRPSAFPESGRRRHTLVLGPSDWGKSELLKALLYHYAQDNSAACVVLDPGGDLVKQVMMWPELVKSDRVRIVQPGLLPGQTVGINPFDGRGLDVEQRRIVANDWAITLGEITEDLSHNMRLLVVNCVQVLLAYPERTNLYDLYKILMERPKARRGGGRPPPTDPRAAKLQEFARNYEVGSVAEFFQHDYDAVSIEGTRQSLRRRIGLVLNLPYAESMLCGEATLDLEQDIEARRFVLVDLARFGEHGSANIGRLFVAMVAAIGRRREAEAREDRTPTHVLIDEVSTMVSPRMIKVLRELRKFGVYQTLAQQRGGDSMSPEQAAALKNIGCKLIATPAEIGRWVDLPNGYNVPEIKPNEFLVSWAKPRNEADPGPQLLRVRSDLVDDTHKVSPEEWAAFLERLPAARGGYFRSAALPSAARAVIEPEDLVDDNVPPELAGRLRQPAEPDEFA